ncbi:hypothetical protein HID58_052037 [Brassica napus]|uniref:(rape) hypothetical protein n=1 Tax=Brassica napus TaxID=3708 RepID=A0A816I073_BRANA|nr:hypothetical protein HID58_052037 [Brassica napus]CAF1700312.1 unnamed protein product [Brassica napus]
MRGDRTRRLVNRDYIDMSCHSPIYSVRKTEQGRGGQAEQRGRGRGQAQLGHGRQVGGRQAEPVEPQTKIPSFGDGSSIQRDWTTSGLIGDPINQREDTCGSVVFTHLLQASYNKDKPIAQHRDLSYLVLANHIQSQTQAKGFSFRNLNIPINYIRNIGLRGKRARGHGGTTTGHFEQRQDASRTFVYDTLERTPLGIVINNFPVFEDVGMGIYHVPLALDNVTPEHALLVLARSKRPISDKDPVMQDQRDQYPISKRQTHAWL